MYVPVIFFFFDISDMNTTQKPVERRWEEVMAELVPTRDSHIYLFKVEESVKHPKRGATCHRCYLTAQKTRIIFTEEKNSILIYLFFLKR